MRRFGKLKLKEFKNFIWGEDYDNCIRCRCKNIRYPLTMKVFTMSLYNVLHNNHNDSDATYIVNYLDLNCVFTLILSIVVQRKLVIVIEKAICKCNEKHPLQSKLGKVFGKQCKL